MRFANLFLTKSFILVVAFLLSVLANAQPDPAKLLGQWKDKSLPDTVRAEGAMRYVWSKFVMGSDQRDSAIHYSNRVLDFSKGRQIDRQKATAIFTLGVVAYMQGNYHSAIEHYDQSLTLGKKLGHSMIVSGTLNNMGMIYQDQGNYEMAEKYLIQCLEVRRKLGDQRGILVSLNNLGALNLETKNLDKAEEYFGESIHLTNKWKVPLTSSIPLSGLGGIAMEKGRYDEAIDYFQQAIKLTDSVRIPERGEFFANLAEVYFRTDRLDESIEAALESYKLSNTTSEWKLVSKSSGLLYQAYKAKGDMTNALKYLEEYKVTQDTIKSADLAQKLIQQRFENDYRLRNDSIKEVQLRREVMAEQEKEKRNLFLGVGGLILLLVIVFSIILFQRLKVTRQQKTVIEEQRDAVDQAYAEVDQKNQEVTASINYAKRLQSAILPSDMDMDRDFRVHFVLYKPRDIVSGDFYWMETVGDKTFFAVADCTGHGVPGAMVSVVCSNALTRAVVEEGIHDTGKLLDRTRELVKQRFGRSDEEINDGMDISLCALDQNRRSMQWSGANNPLWVVRASNNELEEIKGDKQPVGRFAVEKPFTSHRVELNGGDVIYLSSDGFIDQFGGPQGKKYKATNLKKFLLNIATKNVSVQGQLLDEEFEQWKGDIEQIDDVCVMGVRI